MARAAHVVLRRAGVGDAEPVARLHADSWRRHYRGAYSDAYLDGGVERERLEVWTERLSSDDARTVTILAEDGSCLAGFVHLVFDGDACDGTLIDNLHVAFDRKRAGIGTRLLAEAAATVVGRRPAGLYLWVLEQNAPAQAFYRARGGTCTGRRQVRPPGGVPGRLQGAPAALRYAWAQPATLLV